MMKTKIAELETKATEAGNETLANDCRNVLAWHDFGQGDPDMETTFSIARVERALSVAAAHERHRKLGFKSLN